MSEAQQALARSEKVVEEDHRQIRQMLETLRTSTDMAELTATLTALRPALHLHFSKEEQPGGFLASLADCAPEGQDDELVRLLEEHREMRTALDRICKTVAQPGMNHVAVHAATASLVGLLTEHERREQELAETALRGPA
jgi:hypothetical protein